jgi:hypothetical protein
VTGRDLTDWIRSQLIVEGTTAREAMFINAIDGIGSPQMWRYSRHVVDEDPDGRSTFASRLLGSYDPAHDYEPWKQQSPDEAVGEHLRRVNERLITGDRATRKVVYAAQRCGHGEDGGRCRSGVRRGEPALGPRLVTLGSQ